MQNVDDNREGKPEIELLSLLARDKAKAKPKSDENGSSMDFKLMLKRAMEENRHAN